MNKAFAEQFAEEWIAAWNAHDLEAILSHYTDDFEMASPVIKKIAGEPSGVLSGKKAVGRYWAEALGRNPGLRFELLHVLMGVASVTLVYSGVRGLSAEVFHFNATGKVIRAGAHYHVCR